jgi:hypothetical protein
LPLPFRARGANTCEVPHTCVGMHCMSATPALHSGAPCHPCPHPTTTHPTTANPHIPPPSPPNSVPTSRAPRVRRVSTRTCPECWLHRTGRPEEYWPAEDAAKIHVPMDGRASASRPVPNLCVGRMMKYAFSRNERAKADLAGLTRHGSAILTPSPAGERPPQPYPPSGRPSSLLARHWQALRAHPELIQSAARPSSDEDPHGSLLTVGHSRAMPHPWLTATHA